jgi:ketosteroid isomerase-like protein
MSESDAAVQTNAELLRRGYEDFVAGDVPAVLAIFAEDISWKIPGHNPVAGDYTGHDEVMGFFQKLGEGSNGTFTITVQDILDNDDGTVVALVTHLAQRDDVELETPAVHVWQVDDGICTSHVSYVFDVHSWDAFWS